MVAMDSALGILAGCAGKEKRSMTATPPERNARKSLDPVQSVARALELIEALQHQEYVTIGELAELHGVHRATTLRLLQTLERFGYVARGRTRGEFKLGLKLFELGAAFSERYDLLRAARPMMRHLASATGETVDLALYENGEMLLIESIAARPSAHVGSPVGRRVSASCTTTGKLHFAAMPEHEIDRILSHRGLPQIGPKSITNRDQLLVELARVRANGYALNDEETDVNVRFVGVPIDLPGDPRRPCLILGAPAHRLPLNNVPKVARMLKEAAGHIADVA
jgi:DNA-binding IclR family transcriptional regulator